MPATSFSTLPHWLRAGKLTPSLFDNTPPGGWPRKAKPHRKGKRKKARRGDPVKRPPRAKYFARGTLEDAVGAANLVRGMLIDRLDKEFCGGRLGGVMGRDSDDPRLRTHAMSVFQEIMLVLFPEEFAEVEYPGEIPWKGLVPAHGLKRAGVERMLSFVAACRLPCRVSLVD